MRFVLAALALVALTNLHAGLAAGAPANNLVVFGPTGLASQWTDTSYGLVSHSLTDTSMTLAGLDVCVCVCVCSPTD